MVSFSDLFKNILYYHSKNNEITDDLPYPRLKRTVFVNDDEWLHLVSIECEE